MIDKSNGITLEVLAKNCGVSVTTMHRYLNKQNLLKSSTKNKIRAILESKRHLLAHATQTKLKNICLFIHDPQLLMTSDIIRATQPALRTLNYNMTIVDSHDERELRTTLLANKQLLPSVDGLIAFAFDTYEDFSGVSEQYDVPVVCINSRGNKIGTSFNNNNYTAGEDAAKYLIAKGYRKIGFIGWDMDDKRLSDRYMGWNSICTQNTITHYKALAPITPEGGYQACKKLMESYKPDAIFFACDAMALGGINYLNSQSLKLGDDVGVLGFDNILPASFIGLSTMDQYIEEKISHAMRIIMQAIDEQSLPQLQEIAYTPKIIERKSTIRERDRTIE